MKKLLATVAAISISACASTQSGSMFQSTPPPMPSGYDYAGPEPSSDEVLAALSVYSRSNFRDPYTIRDIVICAPSATEASLSALGRWQPASWSFNFGLNGRNAYGGYIGFHHWVGHYREGSITRAIDLSAAYQRVRRGMGAIPFEPNRYEECRQITSEEWATLME